MIGGGRLGCAPRGLSDVAKQVQRPPMLGSWYLFKHVGLAHTCALFLPLACAPPRLPRLALGLGVNSHTSGPLHHLQCHTCLFWFLCLLKVNTEAHVVLGKGVWSVQSWVGGL